MGAQVILGDALEVLRSLPAGSVDAVVTDPPYGETSLKWDVRLAGWPAEVLRVLKPHGSLWVFGSLRSHLSTVSEFDGWRLAQDVIWEKHNGSNSAADRFRRVHEQAAHWYPANVEWSAVHKEPQFTNDAQRKQVRRKRRPQQWGDLGEQVYLSEDGGPRHVRSVIFARSMHGKAEHETQKPEAILEPLIAYSCPPGGVVLDPFCGSGSTGVAAQRLGRSSILIDNRPECVALAERRLAGDAPLFGGAA
jgi:site-specific DNA-methyltransferase (adenine-specific)